MSTTKVRERRKSGHLISSRHRVVSLTVNGLDKKDVEENIEQEKNARVTRVSDISGTIIIHLWILSSWYYYYPRYPFPCSIISLVRLFYLVIDKLYFQINKSKSTIGCLLITECYFFLSLCIIFFSILKKNTFESI